MDHLIQGHVSEAMHLYDCLSDPSLPLRVTNIKGDRYGN